MICERSPGPSFAAHPAQEVNSVRREKSLCTKNSMKFTPFAPICQTRLGFAVNPFAKTAVGKSTSARLTFSLITCSATRVNFEDRAGPRLGFRPVCNCTEDPAPFYRSVLPHLISSFHTAVSFSALSLNSGFSRFSPGLEPGQVLRALHPAPHMRLDAASRPAASSMAGTNLLALGPAA